MSAGVSVAFPSERVVPRVTSKMVFPVTAAMLGATLITLVNGDTAPLLAIVPLMVLAGALSWVVALGRLRATWTGMTMFGASMLAAGASHVYQTWRFGHVLIGNPDVMVWYDLSRNGFDFEAQYINAPHAVAVWQSAYELARATGLGDDAWIAISVNALVVAISAVLIVNTATLLFPGDRRRSRLVARLVLWCGPFWMFGGLLLRDGFALLIQVIAIFTVVRLLVRGVTAVRLATHVAVLCGLWELTWGIRAEMTTTFPVMGILAGLGFALQGRGVRRPALLAVGLIVTAGIGLALFNLFRGTIITSQAQYLNVITNTDLSTGGLGYRLVVSQPLPIRVITGTIYMHLFPIPIWVGFRLTNWDYMWFKSFAAIFVIAVTPLAALGFWRSITAALAGRPRVAPFFFLALYWPLMVAAVAVTSLETRHLGQFIPVFILLAAVPDISEEPDRWWFRMLAVLWYGAVVAGHLLWLFVGS